MSAVPRKAGAGLAPTAQVGDAGVVEPGGQIDVAGRVVAPGQADVTGRVHAAGEFVPAPATRDGFVHVRGAREHNLKDVDLDVPRDALVVFTGVSGSGKSSLVFSTLFAEAQRRYLDSVSPYARRLLDQVGVPDVDSIEGLPPAIALQQQRGTPSSRSSVGSVTTISNLLRMLYSRAGSYRSGRTMLYAEDFSPNTPQGACPTCHGVGRLYDVTEQAMVPDDSLSIRERAVAAWPSAWQGQNLRDILTTMGHDIDVPWRDLPKKVRDWILFTDEQPTVPVFAGFTLAEARTALKRKTVPSYQGTFTGARRYVLHTFANSQSALMRRRVARFLSGTDCPTCGGKRLKREALDVTFAGLDIADLSHLSLDELRRVLDPAAHGVFAAEVEATNEKGAVTRASKATSGDDVRPSRAESKRAIAERVAQGGSAHQASGDVRRTPNLSEEKRIAAQRITHDVVGRVETLQRLGLGYLSLDRGTPTLSPGELQRLRLATQIRSNLFGVVYVLDEPSAGLHPADCAALLDALASLKRAGNSLFVVEHDLQMMAQADWLVDVGPAAGELGGQILYSGPPAGLRQVEGSLTRNYLFGRGHGGQGDAPALPVDAATASDRAAGSDRATGSDRAIAANRTTAADSATATAASPSVHDWLGLADVTRNNLHGMAADFPLHALTAVTGISGSGKSSLVSQALVELVSSQLAGDDGNDPGGSAAAGGETSREAGDAIGAGDGAELAGDVDADGGILEAGRPARVEGRIRCGMESIRRLVQVDQKPIGRTPRSNLATYTGLFDHVRKVFAATRAAKARRYDAGRFSFNVAKGRCETCEGEGYVSVELLFMPSVYAPCSTCHGARYNARTLEIRYRERNIAEVLAMTVDEAGAFFDDLPALQRPLALLARIGLGYLRLGQPATELSGGEAQRIKLATELQRPQRGDSLYVLDEPTTGLHPADVDRLLAQLHALVEGGNTVVVVEHDMRVAAACDWIIDMGPGAGSKGGRIVAAGPPAMVARAKDSRTAPFLASQLWSNPLSEGLRED